MSGPTRTRRPTSKQRQLLRFVQREANPVLRTVAAKWVPTGISMREVDACAACGWLSVSLVADMGAAKLGYLDVTIAGRAALEEATTH